MKKTRSIIGAKNAQFIGKIVIDNQEIFIYNYRYKTNRPLYVCALENIQYQFNDLFFYPICEILVTNNKQYIVYKSNENVYDKFIEPIKTFIKRL